MAHVNATRDYAKHTHTNSTNNTNKKSIALQDNRHLRPSHWLFMRIVTNCISVVLTIHLYVTTGKVTRALQTRHRTSAGTIHLTNGLHLCVNHALTHVLSSVAPSSSTCFRQANKVGSAVPLKHCQIFRQLMLSTLLHSSLFL